MYRIEKLNGIDDEGSEDGFTTFDEAVTELKAINEFYAMNSPALIGTLCVVNDEGKVVYI